MRRSTCSSTTWSRGAEPLAIQVLEALTQHHRIGTLPDLAGLADSCGASLAELDVALVALDDEGFVDRAELRVTLAGFAIGLQRRAAAIVDGSLAA